MNVWSRKVHFRTNADATTAVNGFSESTSSILDEGGSSFKRRVATRLTFLEGVGAGEGTRGGVHTPAGDMIERRMVV